VFGDICYQDSLQNQHKKNKRESSENNG